MARVKSFDKIKEQWLGDPKSGKNTTLLALNSK